MKSLMADEEPEEEEELQQDEARRDEKQLLPRLALSPHISGVWLQLPLSSALRSPVVLEALPSSHPVAVRPSSISPPLTPSNKLTISLPPSFPHVNSSAVSYESAM